MTCRYPEPRFPAHRTDICSPNLGCSPRRAVLPDATERACSSGELRPMPEVYTAELVIERFREAGATLYALQVSGCRPAGYRAAWPEIVRTFAELVEALPERRKRLEPPSAAAISRMDQTMSWLRLIPDDRRMLRRIVCARALVNPVTERAVMSWRNIAARVGASHTAVRTWHDNGIDMIVQRLQEPGLCARSGGSTPVNVPITMARLAAPHVSLARIRELA